MIGKLGRNLGQLTPEIALENFMIQLLRKEPQDCS